ncbi:unnamed protein product [Timema podura]|uniref:Uncharacterized protein n=1 Tax=Timema podura TaxID=61482 RepID=A0ABN7PIF9_TIMPD|nr:unnamed protein product [Timema podura]
MHMSSELQEEGQVLIVRSWKEIINLAANRELCAHIQAIQTVLPNKTLTLVVYGTEQYFRFQKKRKNCEMRGQVLGVNELQNKPHHMSSVEEIPRVTRQILEEVLAEVQLFTGCCVRLVESPPELGALVVYFTKAVAEMPFNLLAPFGPLKGTPSLSSTSYFEESGIIPDSTSFSSPCYS